MVVGLLWKIAFKAKNIVAILGKRLATFKFQNLVTLKTSTHFRQLADLVLGEDEVLQVVEAAKDLRVESGRIRFRIYILDFEVGQTWKAGKLKNKNTYLV